jgi:REP element-mobilizing transposase RayT
VFFVTICSFDHLELFGNVVDGRVIRSAIGDLIDKQWLALEQTFSTVKLDKYVIMPNHLHGLVILQPDGDKPITLGNIIRQFKAKSTSIARRDLFDSEAKLWQRNYNDHVLRRSDELNAIRKYIITNPSNWDTDEYLPKRK